MDQAIVEDEIMEGKEEEPLMGIARPDIEKQSRSLPSLAMHAIGLFLMTSSAVFYAAMLHRVPSDMECTRLNWAWSKWIGQAISCASFS
jgi:hypothetical protein